MSHRLMMLGLLLVLFLTRVGGLSCLCNRESCAPPGSLCQYGTTLDPCFCCTVCLQGPGERCGGPFDIGGKCGSGLFCSKKIPGDFNAEGSCQPGHARGSQEGQGVGPQVPFIPQLPQLPQGAQVPQGPRPPFIVQLPQGPLFPQTPDGGQKLPFPNSHTIVFPQFRGGD